MALGGFNCMYVCVPCVHTHVYKKQVSDPLVLELQTVVRYNMGAGDPT